MSDQPVMFKDLHPEIQATLRNLSRDGFIYIGRTGVGLTYAFRKEAWKIGTVKAIERYGEQLAVEERQLLEVVSVEGPKWVPYERCVEILWPVLEYPKDVQPVTRRQTVWAMEK